ncbi:MAG: hypothetical protein RJB34_1674 [Pseudomonadota bacterium]
MGRNPVRVGRVGWVCLTSTTPVGAVARRAQAKSHRVTKRRRAISGLLDPTKAHQTLTNCGETSTENSGSCLVVEAVVRGKTGKAGAFLLLPHRPNPRGLAWV